MNLAGAAAGANDELQQILAQKHAEFVQQEQIRLRQEAEARQAEQFAQGLAFNREQAATRAMQDAADNAWRTQQGERQTRLDTEAQTDRNLARSRDQNAAGMRRMIGDFLMQRGQTPINPGERQTLQGMGVSEGIELPESVTRDPEAAFAERKRIEDLEHQHRLGEIAAQGAQTRQTATAKQTPTDTTNAYGDERRARTLQSVRDLRGQVSGWTVGAGGLLANLPTTDARSFRGKLDTLKANIAFNELAEMRAASKTGGALGSVAVRELALLENSQGNLDQLQRPEDLAAELDRIEQSLTRWTAATQQAGGSVPGNAGQQARDFMQQTGMPGAAPGGQRTGRYNPQTRRVEYD